MPRGVKGSGKPAGPRQDAQAGKKAASGSGNTAPAETAGRKPRKAYPSREERIALADARIERLARQNDARRAQVGKAEAALDARRAALAKGMEELESAKAKKERLLSSAEKAPRTRRSPEELKALRVENVAKARAAKKMTAKEPKPKLSAEEIRAKRVENAAKARAAKKKAGEGPASKP
ncbi:MAG TPA: hypothetical protein VLA21_07340, partial [Candidatus Limnocylindria bacterium]|nr:hypothetical protein [Candidatus Limnocylindria bacterium]